MHNNNKLLVLLVLDTKLKSLECIKELLNDCTGIKYLKPVSSLILETINEMRIDGYSKRFTEQYPYQFPENAFSNAMINTVNKMRKNTLLTRHYYDSDCIITCEDDYIKLAEKCMSLQQIQTLNFLYDIDKNTRNAYIETDFNTMSNETLELIKTFAHSAVIAHASDFEYTGDNINLTFLQEGDSDIDVYSEFVLEICHSNFCNMRKRFS